MAEAAQIHEPAGAEADRYESGPLGGPLWAFAVVSGLALVVLGGTAVMWKEQGLWLVGLLDLPFLGCMVLVLLWPNLVRGQMWVVCDGDGVRVTFGPLRRREFVLPYAAIGSAHAARHCGKRWAGPADGVLCPCGRGDGPGVHVELRGAVAGLAPDAVDVVVPDPERLAEFLRKRIETGDH